MTAQTVTPDGRRRTLVLQEIQNLPEVSRRTRAAVAAGGSARVVWQRRLAADLVTTTTKYLSGSSCGSPSTTSGRELRCPSPH